MPWILKDYVVVDGDKETNLIAEWYAIQDLRVKAEFDRVMTLLKQREDWRHEDICPEYFKDLDPPHAGLCEVRFSIEQRYPGRRSDTTRRFRPVGMIDEDAQIFTFLVGCEKWGRNYCPNKAFDLALKHLADLIAGGKTVDHHI